MWNLSDESAGGTRQGVKIRALRERLIKGCKLTGANDVAVAPSKLRGLSALLDQPPELPALVAVCQKYNVLRSPVRVSSCIVPIIRAFARSLGGIFASRSETYAARRLCTQRERERAHRAGEEAEIYLGAKG